MKQDVERVVFSTNGVGITGYSHLKEWNYNTNLHYM